MALLCLAPAAAWAQTVAFTVQDPAIKNITGMARDTVNHVYWLVQPGSADDPEMAFSTVHGVDDTGQTRVRLTFLTAVDHISAVGWSNEALYVADITDPTMTRPSVTIYGLPTAAITGDKEVPHSTYQLVYPDHPHDAEAVLIHPDGRLFLWTLDGRLYKSLPDLRLDVPNTLAYVGSVPAGVTDGLFLSLDTMAVRTDDQVLLVDATSLAVTASADLDQPGQSLTLDLTGQRLLVAGEGENASVMVMPIPGLPVDDASTPGGRAAEVRSASRTGTSVMILAAAALALVGGVLAFLRR